jgi:alcohol dehydrogenase (cytochrome c)
LKVPAPLAVGIALVLAGCTASNQPVSTTSPLAPAETTAQPASDTSGPDAGHLASAATDDNDWLLPGKTLMGNRYTGLRQVTLQNVASLRRAWITPVTDDGEEEASPIIYQRTLYVSTAHDGILALDATDGKLKWAFPYTPAYELQYAVNRGVGLADGRVFIATQDCRLVAVDANTGKRVWNVPACKNTSNTWYSTAAYIYNGQVIVGTSGGDLGSMGEVRAFSTADGSHLWDFNTVPQPGELHHNTWIGDSWKHGGAAVWAGLSIDPARKTLFITPGNPGPNLTLYGRDDLNLYTNSIVSVDISTTHPKVNWYDQIIPKDTHDVDPSMPPVLFTGTVDGRRRELAATADKAGDFLIYDRTTGAKLHKLGVSTQTNIFTTVPTLAGTFACPNHGGGVEWNGGSYDPASNLFLVPSTNECGIWKVTTTGPVPYIPGQPYSAGPLPKRNTATGLVTAIDVSNGHVRWQLPLQYAGQGGVLITATGLAFTTDARGRIYALEARTGRELWHDDTGSSIVAPISAYAIDGNEYIAVMAGEAGNQQTPNLPKTRGALVIAYRLNAPATIANTTAGQPKPPSLTERTESGPAGGATQTGPYTLAQAQTGKTLYTQNCAVCHGAKLQGVSAPALTGTSFGHAHLNVSQIRTITTQQMPLGAPGSLKPDQYAAILAYMLQYNCIAPANEGKTPFPTTDEPALKNISVNGATCPK